MGELIGFTSIHKGGVIEVQPQVWTNTVYRLHCAATANQEILVVTYAFFTTLLVIRIVGDTTIAIVVANIFRHHEGVRELAILHHCLTREKGIRIVVEWYLDFVRLFGFIIVTRDSHLHLVPNGDIHRAVEPCSRVTSRCHHIPLDSLYR